jgi:hypothetical protein
MAKFDRRAYPTRREGMHMATPILVTDALVARGLPPHLVNHLATMADMHRASRYDWTSNDVLALTGCRPLSMREFARKYAATFTAPEKGARLSLCYACPRSIAARTQTSKS